jgi:polyisoprenoid-binding protein YceI
VVRGAYVSDLTALFPEDFVVLNRLFAVSLLALPVAALAADSYTLDPYHTFPVFTVDHQGLSTMYGRFDKSSGKATLDRAAKSGSLDLAIETASVTTGDGDKGTRARSRDEQLRSVDFFNVAEFPRMTYTSTKFVFTGDNLSGIEGNLTLLGVTKPVNLTVERFKCNPAQGTGKERCGGNATGKIKRTDFGMKFGVPSVGDEIALMVEFEAQKD